MRESSVDAIEDSALHYWTWLCAFAVIFKAYVCIRIQGLHRWCPQCKHVLDLTDQSAHWTMPPHIKNPIQCQDMKSQGCGLKQHRPVLVLPTVLQRKVHSPGCSGGASGVNPRAPRSYQFCMRWSGFSADGKSRNAHFGNSARFDQSCSSRPSIIA